MGKFLNTTDASVRVTLGKPLRLPCPPRSYSFGVSYEWVPRNHPSLLDKSRVATLTNGDLLFTHVMQEDVNASAIRCQMRKEQPYNDPAIETSGSFVLVKDGGQCSPFHSQVQNVHSPDLLKINV